VRKGTPVVPRPSQPGAAGPIEAELDLGEPADHIAPRRARTEKHAPASEERRTSVPEAASAPARIVAGLIDLIILSSIDAAVIYFTLRLVGLTFRDLAALPIVPLAAFLLLLDGGYFSLFTAAGGQTIGKMAAGIRVVTNDGLLRIGFGTAVVRAAAYFGSLLPAGAGFLPILFTGDRRALHDRLADTRVVKA
jgi:uncharacterized RDD family membrane protein YckC